MFDNDVYSVWYGGNDDMIKAYGKMIDMSNERCNHIDVVHLNDTLNTFGLHWLVMISKKKMMKNFCTESGLTESFYTETYY